jgi:WD40 repeat protein
MSDDTKALVSSQNEIVTTVSRQIGIADKLTEQASAILVPHSRLSQPPTMVAISPSGRFVIHGSSQVIRLWDLASGFCVRILEGHTDEVISVAFSPDGNQALSCSSDETLRLWDLESGVCLRIFSGHKDWVGSVAFSPDGILALSGCVDGTIRLWEVESGACIRIFEGCKNIYGYADAAMPIAFSFDGRKALVGIFMSDAIQTLDLKSGAFKEIYEGTGDEGSVAFSPDGRLALSGNFDGEIHMWNLDNGNCRLLFKKLKYGISSVAISSDGSLALCGYNQGTIVLRDAVRGAWMTVYNSHSRVHSVALSPDERFIISATADATIRYFEIKSCNEIARCYCFDDGSWAVKAPDGRYDSSNNGECPNLRWTIGLTSYPMSKYRYRYHTPGLLAKILGDI